MYAEHWEKACSCDAPPIKRLVRQGGVVLPWQQAGQADVTDHVVLECRRCGVAWRRVVPMVVAEASQP